MELVELPLRHTMAEELLHQARDLLGDMRARTPRARILLRQQPTSRRRQLRARAVLAAKALPALVDLLERTELQARTVLVVVMAIQAAMASISQLRPRGPMHARSVPSLHPAHPGHPDQKETVVILVARASPATLVSPTVPAHPDLLAFGESLALPDPADHVVIAERCSTELLPDLLDPQAALDPADLLESVVEMASQALEDILACVELLVIVVTLAIPACPDPRE